MKLRRLRILRLPGIEDEFELSDLGGGLNVVLGPNASGKSSLCRALRALLYNEPVEGPVFLEAELENTQGRLRVVRQGREVHWEREGRTVEPPRLPDSRMVSCFTVQLEDLLAEGETEREIGARMGRLLAGGYDLDALRQSTRFLTSARHARTEAEQLREAEAGYREARREQRELLAQESRLDELRERKAAADGAAARIAPLTTALALLQQRRGLAAIDARLQDLPSAMERLVGDEPERLEKLRSALERERQSFADLQEESSNAERQQRLAGLEADAPGEAALAEQRLALGELRTLEQERKGVESGLAEAESALGDAIRELGGELPPRQTRLAPDAVRRAEAGLGRKRGLDARLQAIEEQLAFLDVEEVDEATLGQIHQARSALSSWLASPDRTRAQPRRNWPWALLLLLISLGGIGATAWLVHWAFALLAAVVLVAGFFLLRRGEPMTDRRGDAQSDYLASGLEEPEEWTEEALRRRLAALDGEALAAERSRVDAGRRRGLERQRETFEVQAAQVDRELGELAGRVGFDPQVLDGSFDRWLRLVAAYDGARARASALDGKRKSLVDKERSIRSALLAFLARFGEAPDEPAAGSALLDDRLQHLEARLRQRAEAQRILARCERGSERLLKVINRIGEEIAAVYTAAELQPDDDAGLESRLRLREEWRIARDSRRDGRAVARDTERRLGDEPELLALVDADDRRALEAQLQAATDLAGEQERLSNEIHMIENAVTRARAGQELEQARARVADCEERLRERLEEERFAEAAGFLLTDVEREHAEVSRPTVLRRAEEWFARFTRHAFQLAPRGTRSGNLLVRESASGEERTADQLSSGTRMQLFLALRLAFAMEAERGRERLPFFLDEALTVTDPERFRAVAECVHAMAAEQERQLFYLTAQPHDLHEWEALGIELRPILLHEVRRLAAALPDRSDVALQRLEPIPSSVGKTAEEYAELLQVPRVALWEPAERLHLFHLLRDELPLLERLLDRGVRRLGPLRNLLGSEAAALVLTPAEREELRWRSSVVEVFLEACRQGRGRPVNREVLVQSGLSSTFLDRFGSLAGELDGQARALLDAIDAKQDERVKRFRADQREQLQLFLEERGHIDTRPTLGLREIELRVLAAAFVDVESGTTTPERVAELTRYLAATALPHENDQR